MQKQNNSLAVRLELMSTKGIHPSNLTDFGLDSYSRVEWLAEFIRKTREVPLETVTHFLKHYESGDGDWTGCCGGKHRLVITLKSSEVRFFSTEYIFPEIPFEDVLENWTEIRLVTGGYYAPKDGLIARNNGDGTAQVFSLGLKPRKR